VKTWLARAALAAILALGAARADAQITAVINAPKRTDAKVQAAAQREQVAQDSVARVTLTGMKQWVDSAAEALAIRPDTGTVPSETAVVSKQPSPPTDSVATPPSKSATPATAVRDGVRAPNTATQMPTIVLVGFVLILLGDRLRRRPVRAEVPAPRR
jgi:hypothetical protein